MYGGREGGVCNRRKVTALKIKMNNLTSKDLANLLCAHLINKGTMLHNIHLGMNYI